MQSFKEFINEEALTVFPLAMSGSFPISPKFWSHIKENQTKIRAYHALGQDNLKGFNKLAHSKRGVNYFTKTSDLDSLLSGLMTDGGIILKVEGTRLISNTEDFHSMRDTRGNKWITLSDMQRFHHGDEIMKLILEYYPKLINLFIQEMDRINPQLPYKLNQSDQRKYSKFNGVRRITSFEEYNDFTDLYNTMVQLEEPDNKMYTTIAKAAYKWSQEVMKANIATFVNIFANLDFLDAEVKSNDYNWNELIMIKSEVIAVYYKHGYDFGGWFDDVDEKEVAALISKTFQNVPVHKFTSDSQMYGEFKKNWSHNKKQLGV